MKVVHVYEKLGKQAYQAAQKFSILLSLEKGYSSEIKEISGGFSVQASNGLAINFMS